MRQSPGVSAGGDLWPRGSLHIFLQINDFQTSRVHDLQRGDFKGCHVSFESQSSLTSQMKEHPNDRRGPQLGQSQVGEDQFRLRVPLNTSMVDTRLFRNV